jgi:multidrug transporter EmrE-like cation transporter
MRLTLVLFVLTSVLLSSGSQVLMKFGMSAPDLKSVLASDARPVQIAYAIAVSPSILLGMFCFGLSAIVWLFVLSKIPLSSAYPFVALGIAITVAAGRLIFDEPISPVKLVGIGLVIIGVLTVAISP